MDQGDALMKFLDTLTKTLSTGVDRARFEAEKFQHTSRISGEINNIVSQIETNTRQLGERALELYQQGLITAPEIASLAQIINQLREQQAEKERELQEAQNETFETWQARQPQPPEVQPSPTGESTNEGESSQVSSSQPAAGTATYICSNCGRSLPANARFCPHCGTPVAEQQA
jgi:hypothetical protein